ncbi:LAQU0S12e03048g1_1 [Lachancea quebecensis]|uniref:LAQU0S12e03048g1_1 n=1 Tax=Lachancea quebecensis TaxID=1654605 RepID=A0A0P1KUY8_9SACH|nr:LAQU0S12e03048g1_1 [Lachancea quebecensis]
MSHSIIVSNVPVDVSDVSVMRYIREMTGNTPVVHMQPFPDECHYVNDSNATKTLQIFFATAEEAAIANSLFQGSSVEEDLTRVHALFHGDREEHVPRSMASQGTAWNDTQTEQPVRRSRIKSLST